MTLEKNKIKLIYIMGAGHSGSTLLDITLGNHLKIQNCGELNAKFFTNYKDNIKCTCGKNSTDCEFLNTIMNHWEHTSSTSIKEYIQLQKQFESLICYYPSFLKNNDYQKYNTYQQQTYSFFKSISSKSGKNILVDSSKNPLRALNLSKNKEIELVLVHLVRDGRGFTYSLMKKNMKRSLIYRNFNSAIQSSKWASINFLSEIIYSRAKCKKIRIKYEDFVVNPSSTLNQIGKLIDLDFYDIGQKLEASGINIAGHTLEGNRMRHKSNIINLKPDYEWEQKLKFRDIVQFLVFSWPFVLKYRYY